MTDGEDATGGYVHDPDAFREQHEDSTESETTSGSGGSKPVPRNDPHPDDPTVTVPGRESFGRRGWILVGALVVAFLVVPAIIVLVPPAALPFEVAFLILPLAPAVILGLLAIWSALGGASLGA
jgi:hypothetical protein